MDQWSELPGEKAIMSESGCPLKEITNRTRLPIKSGTSRHGKSRIERSRQLVNIFLYSLIFGFCAISKHSTIWPLAYRCLEILGYIAVVVGTVGRLWCGQYIFGRKKKELCRDGPYSVCRNPLYLFSFIAGVGVAAQCHSSVVMIVFASLFCGYYFLVIKSEERRLAGLFGDEYDDYCRTVPRVIPRLGIYRTAETISVPMKVFLPAMMKGLWPIMAAEAAELIQILSAQWSPIKFLPTNDDK
jgi:protein-S-isoprenylcysteine O-methyltransferase Ste14